MNLGIEKKSQSKAFQKELLDHYYAKAEMEIPSRWGLDLTKLCAKCSGIVKKAYVERVLMFRINT